MATDQTTDYGNSDKMRLSMWLTKRQHSELKELAAYEGRTVSDIIRQLVGIHLRDNAQNNVQRKDAGGKQ